MLALLALTREITRRASNSQRRSYSVCATSRSRRSTILGMCMCDRLYWHDACDNVDSVRAFAITLLAAMSDKEQLEKNGFYEDCLRYTNAKEVCVCRSQSGLV
jgi:hypothetical protein